MNFRKISLLAVAIATFGLLAFTGKKADTTLKVDAAKSGVKWIGRKVTGAHDGTIAISSGTLITDGKVLKGGTFDIDMNSIACSDLKDAEYNGKLIGHLKAEDFFNVAKFPKASFVISKVTSKGGNAVDITGKLTIKGITHDLTFPAEVITSPAGVTASAKILVDRTKYDIRYGSKSFFDNLGDKAIENDFELNVSLVAGK